MRHLRQRRAPRVDTGPLIELLSVTVANVCAGCEGLFLHDADGDGRLDVYTTSSNQDIRIVRKTDAGIADWAAETIVAENPSAFVIGGSGVNIVELEGIGVGIFDASGRRVIIGPDQSNNATYALVEEPGGGGLVYSNTTRLALNGTFRAPHSVHVSSLKGNGFDQALVSNEGNNAAAAGADTGAWTYWEFTGSDLKNPAHWSHLQIPRKGAWWMHDDYPNRGRADYDNEGHDRQLVVTARGINQPEPLPDYGRNPNAETGLFLLKWGTGDLLDIGQWTLRTIWEPGETDAPAAARVAVGKLFPGSIGLDIAMITNAPADEGSRIYLFDRSNNWAVTTVAQPFNNAPHGIAMIPLQEWGYSDRDGFLIFQERNPGDSSEGGIYLYQHNGYTWRSRKLGSIDVAHPYDSKYVWYDVDGDGIKELLFANSGQNTLDVLKFGVAA